MAAKKTSKPVPPKAPPELAAAEIVMNPQDGSIIHAKNADVQRDPASLTKLATAYMVMRAAERGEIKLDDQIRISAGAAQLGNNTFDVGVYNESGEPVLPQGARLTYREALVVMMTSSANGVAKALGEALAPEKEVKGKTVRGSERDFAREMTRVMRGELGMASSSFINASGLNNGGEDQKSNLSTARDLAVLNQRMMKDFPEFERLLSAHTATTRVLMPDGQRLTKHSATTNHFVRDFAEGSARAKKEGFHLAGAQKTGYNRLTGGINLLSTAENGEGVRLTSVVLGGRDSDRRYAANLRNLREGFRQVHENPVYATVYRVQPDVPLVAAASPSSAFADASKPRAASRARKPDIQVARADESRPRGSFNSKAAVRTPRERRPAPVAEPRHVSFTPEPGVDTATLRTALSVMPAMSADGAASLPRVLDAISAGSAPAASPPEPNSGISVAERLGLRRPSVSAQPE